MKYLLTWIFIVVTFSANAQKGHGTQTFPDVIVDPKFCGSLIGITGHVSDSFQRIKGKILEMKSYLHFDSKKRANGAKYSYITKVNGTWRYEGELFRDELRDEMKLEAYYNVYAAQMDSCLLSYGYRRTTTANTNKRLRRYADIIYLNDAGTNRIVLNVFRYSKRDDKWLRVLVSK